ncbi:MAG: SDR family oxidoreductase [Sphingomonadales bacterium]|nr:SDR family oxidoreductase [Sphingomonadales bacterium]
MSTGEFAGKVVLVTGAASGLGQAASIRFAAEGARLCLVDLNDGGLEDTAQAITDAGSSSVRFVGDLGQQANCAAAVATAMDAFGRLDVLCNVAGMLRMHPLAEISVQDWDRLLSANLSAPLYMMQAAMPHLIEAHGNVINVVSTAAFLGQAYMAPYGATKAALLSLTRSLAMEFMHQPVRINALAPGGMLTPMATGLKIPDGLAMDLVGRYMGIRPPSEIDDIVEPLMFLASDRAKGVHGTCYTADNGITAG